MNKVLRGDELLEISNFFLEKGYTNSNITVVIEVENEKELGRVNDDYFYRYNDGKSAIDNDIDEVNINIGGIKFKYKVKEASE